MTKLFVGNLSYQLTEEEFKNTFQPYGNIKSLRLLTNKGFGFVEYETAEEAQKAIENLNGKELKGRPMRVELAKPREEGFRSNNNRFRNKGFSRNSSSKTSSNNRNFRRNFSKSE
ncbi:MAG: RNA recognition motif domain-containing protein [bacterium]